MAAHELEGRVVKGKYRIDRLLGEGGMGFVVAAQHLALDQRVAIKFLHPAMLAHPAIVERFAREARAASKIQSDHVARVTDVDVLEDGTPFMVMEHLEGHDLSRVRREGRGLPVPIAVGYLLEACEALGEAHRLGIVHRDIKPANLFLAQRGDGRTRVKVLDFGISKMSAAAELAPSLTQTAVIMGSSEYMSPEQMMSARDADARSDIWALGVTLYELLTARVPFPGETITQICILVTQHSPPPPSSFRPDVPFELDAVIVRCLAKDRTNRYASVAELVVALGPFTGAAYAARHVPGTPVGGTALIATQPIAAVAPEPFGQESTPGACPPHGERVVVEGGGVGTMAATSGEAPARPKMNLWKPVAIGVGVTLAVAVVAAVATMRPKSSELAASHASEDLPTAASAARGPTPSETVVADPPAPSRSPPVVTPARSAAASAPHSTAKPVQVRPIPAPIPPPDTHRMD